MTSITAPTRPPAKRDALRVAVRQQRFQRVIAATLLFLLAMLALILGSASVAHAQTTAPTVSTVAVTSNPGTDDTYALGDTMEVGLTFSEAVTVTGAPYLLIDVGGTNRRADYNSGTGATQLLFRYTVLAGDDDDDGIAVVENSLTLNGGTIVATDDSTAATLDHAALTTTTHKVDIYYTLVSNMTAHRTTNATVSATDVALARVQAGTADAGYQLQSVVLDVVTPSDTLEVEVNIIKDDGSLVGIFEGSVTTSGPQTFTIRERDSGNVGLHQRGLLVRVVGSGEGTVVLGVTHSEALDIGASEGWGLTPSGVKLSLIGYEGQIPHLTDARIYSSPYDDVTYTAGERIEIQLLFSYEVQLLDSSHVIPFRLGTSTDDGREAELVAVTERRVFFAYTVQPGDSDMDGPLLPTDVDEILMKDGDAVFANIYDENVRGRGFSATDIQASTGHPVDGSLPLQCQVLLCGYLNVAWGVGASYPDQFEVDYSISYDWITASSLKYAGENYSIAEVFSGFGDSIAHNRVKLAMDFQRAPSQRLFDRAVFHIGELELPLRDATRQVYDQFVRFRWGRVAVDPSIGTKIPFKIVENVDVSFAADSYTVNEDGTVDVEVTLSADLERDATAPITVTNQDGATDDDYATPESVTIMAGETSKSFVVTPEDDDVDDDGESLQIEFGDLPGNLSPGTTTETVVTIVDNDDPEVEVSFGQPAYDVAEGASQTVAVNLSADPERTVVIPLTATNQDGASSADYSVPASVTFDSGETSKDITFAATDDSEDDDGESVKLTFGTLPDRVTAGAQDETVVSIDDDDAPTSVAVSWGEVSYTVAEGGTVTVTVELDDDPEKTVTVPIQATGQNGATSSDYSGVPTSVTFNSGDTAKTFSFQAAQDTLDDDGESVKLSFGPTLPTGVTEGAPGTATVSITDDDLAGDRLVSLVVAPKDIDGFDPEVTGYMVGVASTVSRATITATPAQPDSTVTIDGTAVNAGSAHAVDLSAGLNTFEVVVTSADNDQTTYTVYVGRGTTGQGGWKAGDDLDTLRAADNTEPSGIWSNGTTVWIADVSNAKLYAYSQADGARDGDKDIAVNGVIMAPTGVWSDNTTIWVIDPVEMTAFAYTLGSGARDSNSDISLGSDLMLPVDTWSDGVTMWVLDSHDDKLYAYTLADDTRDSDKDIDLAGDNAAPFGVWSNGTTVWVTDRDDRKLYAYNFLGERVAGHDIDLHSRNADAGVIWGNDDTLWVVNDINDVRSPFNRVFTYNNVPVTVSFGQSSYTVAESDDTSTSEVAENAVEVKVTLSADPKRQVVVPITATNLGNATGADYSGVPANLTFESGETEKSFTFTATHDTRDDDGESVQLAFGTLPPGVSGGAYSEAVVSITDDDIGVSFERMGYETTEGDSVDVKVTLSSPATREVTIPLDADKQGGASDDDYTGVQDSITFRSSDTETSIRFTAVDDEVDDDGEKVRLRFGTLPTGLVPGANVEATITITDNDMPTDRLMSLVVAPKDIDGFDSEVTDYMVGVASTVTQATITATPYRSDDTVTIDGTTVTGGSDHSVALSVGLNTFAVVVDSAATQEQTTYTVYIGRGTNDQGGWKAGDDLDTLRSPGNISPTGAWSNATTTWIADSNDGKLYAYTLADGSRDSDKDITLDSNNSNPVGIWSDDTTIWVADLMPTERKVYAYTLADGSRDSDKDITLRDGNTSSWGVWSDGTTMWVVDWNDDELYAYTLADDSRDSDKDIALHGDNTSPRGIWSDDTTMWVVDSTGAKLYAYALSDGVRVGGYDIGLHSSNAGAGGIWANDDTAWVVNRATEDGSPFDRVFTYNNIPVRVSFGQSTYAVAEGGSVTVKVTLSADPKRQVVIPLTATGQDGASGADYSAPASVTFESGQTTRDVTFTATEDAVDDDDETVLLGLGATLPAGVTPGSPATSTVAITDNDDPEVEVSFDQSAYDVAEGGDVTITVNLSADPERTVEVPLTATRQGGASGADYSVPATVTFDSGETAKTITFTATQDAIDDDGESVVLGFGALPDGVTPGTVPSSTVSIADDDAPASVAVSWAQTTYSVAEGGSVTVTAELDVDPERAVTIPITATNEGGATDADYSGVPASVTFNAGETSKDITFSATDDTIDDDDERVKLAFGTLPTGITAGTTDETVVSITDDDAPDDVKVSFGSSTYTVVEGASVTVTLNLDVDPERTVTIPITATNENGATDADYSGVPNSVTFESGDTSKSFTFAATDDAIDDDDERVKLAFGTLPTGIAAGTTSETVVSITDDDLAATVKVRFDQSTYSATEGGDDAVVTVILDSPAKSQVEIPLTANGHGGATKDDWSGVPETVSFDTGDNSKSFTVTAFDDNVEDNGEMVELGFGTLPAGFAPGSPSTARITLMNDDSMGVGGTTGQNRVCTKGEITVRGQTDRWVWRITDSSYRDEYTIDLMGMHSNKGTLRDPHIVYTANIYTHDGFYPPGPAYGSFPSYASNDGGAGWDSSNRLRFRNRTGSYSYFPGKEPELDTGYYTALGGANPFGDGANGLGSYTLCIEGPGSISEVDQPERRIVVSAAHLDVSDGEPAQFNIKLGARPTGSVEVFMTKLEPASDSQYVVEPLMHNFTVDNWDIPQVVTVRRKSDYAPPLDDGFAIRYWGKGGGYDKEFEFLEVYDRVPRWMQRRLTYDPEPALTDQDSEAQKQNTPATGGPGISGTPLIGETLTATTSGIQDEDGLTDADFAYQWVRSELGSNSETDIAGATGSSYAVTSDDAGKAIKVRVTFADDAGNEESLTSFGVIATPALPDAQVPDPPGTPDVSPDDSTSLAVSWTVPASDGGSAITGYKVQWKEAAGSWDTSEDVSEAAATGTSHTITGLTDGVEYAVRVMATNDEGDSPASTVAKGTPVAENNTPTGLPTISGTAQVGETLTASTSNIDDEDGLDNVSYSYQWVRKDGTDDTDIAGETSSTYTLVFADQGQTIRVKVTFTDDADNDESLTSAATETVLAGPNRAAAGRPTISGTPQVDQTLTADTSAISDEDGLTNVSWSYQWTAGGTDIEGATSSTYTLVFADQGRTIKVKVSFSDDADNAETLTSVATLAVAAAPNRDATGAPTISGAPQVEQTLTAETSAIEDADGLTNVSYEYQWIAGGTDINGATSSSHELTSSEQGQTIRVRVTFTDDRNNTESLTSEATVAVAAKANSKATGVPTISGTAQVGETLTADTSGIADEDGGENVSYGYQWIRSDNGADTDIAGATDSTYTLVLADQGKTIKVKVSFTDDAENEETLTSVATAAVAAKANTAPTGLPTVSGTPQVEQTLTADTSPIDDEDGLTNATFEYQWLAAGSAISGATGSSYELTSSEQGQTIQVRVTFTDDANNAETLTSQATVAVAAPNHDATGKPTISGTPQVDETLTADTSNIDDEDGLTGVSYSYQWLAGGSEISGATGSSLTLGGEHQGQTIQVTVTFTDDRDNEESLTSAATAEVTAAPVPLTVSVTVSAPATHDGSSEFTFEIEFSEEFGLSYVTLKNHAFNVTGGSVERAQRTDKPSNIPWRITVKPQGTGDVTIELPATTDCGDTGAVCTGDGRMLSNSLNFTVSGPGQ